MDGVSSTPDADIDAPEAWELTTGSHDVVVAVVDTGIDLGHPDLAQNAWLNPGENGDGKDSNGRDDDGNGYVDDWRGWDWANDDNDPTDDTTVGHGTHVSGTIGARGDDGAGISGVNWHVGLMALKVFAASGGATYADIASAFAYAGAMGAKVANASLGGPSFSQLMADSISGAPNTLFVAAAGNSGSNNDASPTYPCSYPHANVVCVAATNQSDALASFSNYGAGSVDLAAPGTNVFSTLPGVPVRVPLFTDDFEGGAGDWVTGGTSTWGITSASSRSGSQSLTDSASGSYADDASTWARTGPLSLTGKQNCALGYWFDLDTEYGYDPFLVEGSTDLSTWTFLTGWWGYSGGFVSDEVDLGMFEGTSALYLRFRLESDFAFTFDGVYVDDVAVGCGTDGSSTYGWGFLDGTSMASPHVAGAAALAWARDPGATVASVRAALLGSVDAKPSLAGVTVTGGRLNLAGVLAAIAAPADTTPPTNPTLTSTSHGLSTWSRDNTVEVSFTGAADAGSGVDGYSTLWTTAPGSVPDTTKDAEETATGAVSPSLTSGSSHYFHLRVRDNAGNWSVPVHLGPFWIDRLPPSGVSMTGAALSRQFQLSTGFSSAWTAADSLSGLRSYDVRYRRAPYNSGYSSYSNWRLGTPADNTSDPFTGSAGNTYCFGTRAVDRVGNMSAWSPDRCTAVPANNTTLTHSSGWTKSTGSSSYLSTYSRTTTKGARLSLGVAAKNLALVATTCPDCGTVDVYLGTTFLKRISLASSVTQTKRLIPIASFTSLRTGTVAIVVASSGRTVRIEGLGVSRV